MKGERFNTVKKRFRPKIKSTNKYKLAFQQLEKKLPRAFNLGRPKPLKIGVLEDLFNTDTGLSKKTIRRALFFYCNSHQYLKQVIVGRVRIDIFGKPTEQVVSGDEAEHAKDSLKKVFKSIKSKNHSKVKAQAKKKTMIIKKRKRIDNKEND